MKSKHYLSLCIFLALAGTVFCVPSNENVWTFTQPDGTTFQAVLLGDEFFSYHQTLEGDVILKDRATGEWFYAEPKADGSLQKTAMRVGQERFVTEFLNMEKSQWLKAVQKAMERKRSEMRSYSDQIRRISPTGTVKGVILLANFSNTSTTYSQSTLNDLMNTNEYNSNGAQGSVQDYYSEVSYGDLSMQIDVHGWFSLSEPNNYYGADDPNDPNNPDLIININQMIEDAIKEADPTVNFADYDSDGDGWVDILGVVHQGLGQEVSGRDPNYIWSKQGRLESPMTVDGVKILYYYTVPELSYPSQLTTIGVYCHEIAHVLGLPDLYDYDRTSVGVGDWSIMASGSWLGPGRFSPNRNGTKPCHFDPWSKYMLGWITPEVIYSPQSGVSLPGFDTHRTALLIPVDPYQDGEYFLVANRYKRATTSDATGFDENLPGSGALILHVDDYMPDNDNENRKKVDVEEADGLASLDMSHNLGDWGDLYPNGRSAFNNSTNPDSRDNDGLSTGIAVYNFTGAGTDTMGCDITPQAQLAGYSIIYDSIGNYWNNGLGFGDDGDDYACVRFVTDQDGILERVKTQFNYSGTTDYTINVYSGWLDNMPTGLLTTQSGSHTGSSYEEIVLSEPQTFSEGAEFVIEIRYNTRGEDKWPLPIVNDGDCSERTYVRSSSSAKYLQLTPSEDPLMHFPFDALIRAGLRSPSQADSQPSVLICGADDYQNLEDVKQKLQGTGQFSSVSTFNLRGTTPTLGELQAHDAVLVYSNYAYQDPADLGNVMVDYVNSGGGVVCMMFEICAYENAFMMEGRWHYKKYWVIDRGDWISEPPASLGTVYIPEHPIMQGVSTFYGGYRSYRPRDTYSGAGEGVDLIANWSDGRPLVAAKTIGGARRVDLGFFPVSSDVDSACWDSSTDGALLMANALKWVARDKQSPKRPNVLLCGADYDEVLKDLQQKLLDTGQFHPVITLDVREETPTLQQLQVFDAILVHSNFSYDEPKALGDVMANYVDGGGGVVSMMFEVGSNDSSRRMQGRWNKEEYFAISRGGMRSGTFATLGTVHDQGHPIMQGVSCFEGGSSSYRPSTTNISPGAVRIADWSDSRPLVVTKTIGNSRRVDLGFYPASSDLFSDCWNSTTDGMVLMSNALKWAARGK